jgi:hypothetical protein
VLFGSHFVETATVLSPKNERAIGGKIIARETVRAFRKDVTAKCYGGGAFAFFPLPLRERVASGASRMRGVEIQQMRRSTPSPASPLTRLITLSHKGRGKKEEAV